jgi:class 3 adenylate cyclase/tetratricopeptide (TPR) repeat protein
MTQVLPSGVITIMFTDLVGSTALSDRLGDEPARALLRAHDRILREQFERFDGKVVKGTGDGFLVAFASPRQGVECAVAVQRALSAQHAEGRYPELQVRIGLHTGEPIAEGGDLLGSDVNLAARIEAEAAGGQVLVSELTRQLARRSHDLEFVALGERMLKGFAEPVNLVEVRWPEDAGARPLLTRFVGRVEERGALQQRLEAAIRGQGGLVLVGGEPGIGKTRLVSELALHAVDRGLQVLSGRAYETEGMPPYLPFVEALQQHVRDRRPDELREELDGNAPYLAMLLPDLQRLLPEIQESPALGPEAERYRLFEGVSDFLLKVAATKPLLLFLDDLHWADGATLLLLGHLARRLPEGPLLAVGTYRDVEVKAQHPIAALLAEMNRQRMGSSITLRPFAREEALALAGAVLGQAPAPHVADALFAATEGNAFFTEELVRHLEEQGRDLTDPGAAVSDWDIPEGVRQVIGRRLTRLGSEANRLLAYSSVLGRDLSVAKVAAVIGGDEEQVLDLLDEAVASHVLRAGTEGYAFAHSLIRDTLYQGLTPPRRRQLHGRVGEALEALYGQDPEPEHLAELAYHFLRAAPGGDIDKAINYATRAAEHAANQMAHEEAARFYRMALEALDLKDRPDELLRCDLLLALCDAQSRAGEWKEVNTTAQQAAEIARRLGAREQLAHAAISFSRGTIYMSTENPGEVALLEEALAALGEQDWVLRARLLSRLSWVLAPAPDSQERKVALADEAIKAAGNAGDPGTLAMALFSRCLAFAESASVDDRLSRATDVVRSAEEAGDPNLIELGHSLRLDGHLALGDIAAMESEMDVLTGLARELRQPALSWFLERLRPLQPLWEGKFEEAERLALQAAAMVPPSLRTDPDAEAILPAQIFAIRRDQGRLRELEGAVAGFVTLNPELPAWRAALAFLYSEIGGELEARNQFEVLAASGFDELRHDPLWTTSLALLSETCTVLGDKNRAVLLYELLKPLTGRNLFVGVTMSRVAFLGCASRNLGLLATTLERWIDAQQHFELALNMHSKMRARPWVARTQHDYAKMLLARDEPGDRDQALALLEQALAVARELGMKALEARTGALKASCDS